MRKFVGTKEGLGRTISTAAIAMAIGACGGVIFRILGLPLPWTLGSLTAAALSAIWIQRWPMPTKMRNFARPVVGVLAGAAFTPEIIATIPQWWSAILLIAIYSTGISVLGYLLFTRIFKFDKVTAYFAATPGGLGELSILGSSLGGNIRVLVMIHSVRVVTIVFGIPLVLQIALGHPIQRGIPASAGEAHSLVDWVIVIGTGVAGYLLGTRLRTPGGIMIAAMLCSALVHGLDITRAVPPGWLVALVQILIGCVAGARFGGLRWAEFRSLTLIAIGWAAVMLASAVGAAWLAAILTGRHFEPLLLAMAPGGTAEMIVITFALGGDVAFVSGAQLCRVFLILAGAPAIFRLLGALRDRDCRS